MIKDDNKNYDQDSYFDEFFLEVETQKKLSKLNLNEVTLKDNFPDEETIASFKFGGAVDIYPILEEQEIER